MARESTGHLASRPAGLRATVFVRGGIAPADSERASGAVGRLYGLEAERLLLDRYERLGTDFLRGLEGEFAIVLRDPGAGRVLLACDGYGGRCLSFCDREDRVETVEESSPHPTGGVEREDLEPLRLAEFFACAEPSTREFFRTARSVSPGELLVLENGRESRHWLRRPDPGRRWDGRSWEEYVETFGGLLRDAVARALGGANRVAVWLSGGLDSSPIAALAARNGCEVDGIVWSVADARGDDLPFARAVASRSGFALHPVPCDDALTLSEVATWPVHPATPEQNAYRRFHDRSYSRAAELGHTLVLTGLCGDALYGHAGGWFWSLLAEASAGLSIDRLREVARHRGWAHAIRSTLLAPLRPHRFRELRFAPAYLTEAARAMFLSAPVWPADAREFRRPGQALRLLSHLESSGCEIERWHAARHGLEIRWPLRDPDLLDFALAVPDHLLQQGEETRPVLRAATQGLLPEEVRSRRGKASFRFAIDRGLEAERLPWARGLLFEEGALWRECVEPDAVLRWVAGDIRSDWEKLGYLQCLFAEIWRFQRNGGELTELASR